MSHFLTSVSSWKRCANCRASSKRFLCRILCRRVSGLVSVRQRSRTVDTLPASLNNPTQPQSVLHWFFHHWHQNKHSSPCPTSKSQIQTAMWSWPTPSTLLHQSNIDNKLHVCSEVKQERSLQWTVFRHRHKLSAAENKFLSLHLSCPLPPPPPPHTHKYIPVRAHTNSSFLLSVSYRYIPLPEKRNHSLSCYHTNTYCCLHKDILSLSLSPATTQIHTVACTKTFSLSLSLLLPHKYILVLAQRHSLSLSCYHTNTYWCLHKDILSLSPAFTQIHTVACTKTFSLSLLLPHKYILLLAQRHSLSLSCYHTNTYWYLHKEIPLSHSNKKCIPVLPQTNPSLPLTQIHTSTSTNKLLALLLCYKCILILAQMHAYKHMNASLHAQ